MEKRTKKENSEKLKKVENHTLKQEGGGHRIRYRATEIGIQPWKNKILHGNTKDNIKGYIG